MTSHWDQAARDFRRDLAREIPTDVMRDLHKLRPLRHVAVVIRQVLVLAAAVYVILHFGAWYAWIPASIAIGFWVFGGTILLHEVIHRMVALGTPAWIMRALGLLYAIPSGLSASQFERWHLDHHDHLGTSNADPKRAYLSPKRRSRLLKLCYFTPVLFPIYFRAAAQAAASYPSALQRTIRIERTVTILFHVSVAAGLWVAWGPFTMAKLYALPVFVVFPVAFSINRLGQHYDVQPDDPAAWATWVRSSPLCWDVLFLWSNYHLEHHYYPRVPFYNLGRLHKVLTPFLEKRGLRRRAYSGLLVDWLIRNTTPHADWRAHAKAETTS